MAKNIVVCCDGTGNEIELNLSSVLKLFRIVRKNEDQRVYYSAGIGTIGSSDAWARLRQNTKSVFALATGYGLDADIVGAYNFICRNYDQDDAIFLFGFSRGAYTVRAVAGLIHMIGLLPPDQLNIVEYALRAYKQASDDDDFKIAWHFSQAAGAREVRIKFLGVWDTVASVFVPRRDRIIPRLLTLPYTRKNSSVEVFRHAMALDERRRLFRLNRWLEPQPYVRNPFERSATVQQDIKQVWFAGVHADIGGGYAEKQSAIAKFPLDWMIREAAAHGLKINTALRNYMVLGRSRAGARSPFVKPDAAGEVHESLTSGWRSLEWIPKRAKWAEWPRRKLLGLYLPNAELRKVDNGQTTPLIHQSVVDRMAATKYLPMNLPDVYSVETRVLASSSSRFIEFLLSRGNRMADVGTPIQQKKQFTRGRDSYGADLFSEDTVLSLPPRFRLKGRILGSDVEQLLRPRTEIRCRLDPFTVRRVGGFETTLPTGEHLRIVGRRTTTRFGDDLILLVPAAAHPSEIEKSLALGEGIWLSPTPLDPVSLGSAEMADHLRAVTASWEDAFQLREAHLGSGTKPGSRGLRRPQVGALHAALAHATRSTAPATIVMPTGTGKTETMLALQLSQSIDRLLVVVPTDALRDQISGKFQTLGILRDQQCLNDTAAYPSVARLAHIPTTIADVDEVFLRANVVVTTMHVAGRASPEVQERMAAWASSLFIDEAHHIGARTWAEFRALFADRSPAIPIVQFTATPFREDGRRVDGEFIYTYPLKKAQAEGYFKPIRFEAVFGLDRDEADLAIAEKLGDVLRTDLEAGRNHLAIARCQTIERAKIIHRLYTQVLPEHHPIIVHSQQSMRERRENLAALKRFESRLIVCVDMLGEGFDLPELKIAALHDHHKSIAVTIQFVGRLTRPDPRLGDATVIANTGVDDIDRSLAKLYAEDADWNTLVEALSSAKIERQIRRAEMFKGFVGDLTDIPLQTLDPKMNAVVYATRCSSWDPHRAEDLYNAGVYLGMKTNPHQRVAIFVTRVEEQAAWTTAGHAIDVTWDLHMLHWDEAKGLLYISSSSKGPYDSLAAAVCGEDVRRVQGEDVFRCLHGFKRLILRNLGLTHRQGRGVRYSMYMGVDVAEGLDSAKSQARIKNNVFGAGFLDGAPAAIGCSAKGKFWSLQHVRDLTDWVDWCQDIGRTVTDPGITTDGVFKSAMRPRQIAVRPPVAPIAIHWPESLLWQLEERVEISFGGRPCTFTECDIELLGHSREGPLKFVVRTDSESAVFEIAFVDGVARYPQREGAKAMIKFGAKERTLSEYFCDDAPHIDFGDGSLLIYSHLYTLPEGDSLPAYPREKIDAWDWSRTNIRAESQGLDKRADSVQRLVIDKLLAEEEPYDVIFDDDGAGEIADVVAVRIAESVVYVTLYHCKYSVRDAPGARVEDLYEVCGQAQKSARWRDRPNRMMQHMLRREKLRLEHGRPTRFELGNPAIVKKLKAIWQDYRYEFGVRIVQPGLSRAAVRDEGLHLLAGAETYLLETRAMPLRVIGSA